MIKNLTVQNFTSYKLSKLEVHNLVKRLKEELNFKIDSMSIIFLGENEILEINHQYLGHNYSTDIITFNYSGENYTLDGEIFISLDDASYFADKYDVSLSNEVLRLVVHGFLHLIGYDDKKSEDRKKMKSVENNLVKKHFNSLKLYC